MPGRGIKAKRNNPPPAKNRGHLIHLTFRGADQRVGLIGASYREVRFAGKMRDFPTFNRITKPGKAGESHFCYKSKRGCY